MKENLPLVLLALVAIGVAVTLFVTYRPSSSCVEQEMRLHHTDEPVAQNICKGK